MGRRWGVGEKIRRCGCGGIRGQGRWKKKMRLENDTPFLTRELITWLWVG